MLVLKTFLTKFDFSKSLPSQHWWYGAEAARATEKRYSSSKNSVEEAWQEMERLQKDLASSLPTLSSRNYKN